MNSADSKEFWSNQTGSLHRSAAADFYRRKAEEHVAHMSPSERAAPIIDLGCGAGELLQFFAVHVNVQCGLDYSASMLNEARKRFDNKAIDLIEGDIFHILPECTYPVWTTTGALNQYLSATELERFLDVFLRNQHAQSLLLFDCVDPIRYAVLPFGPSYSASAPQRRNGIAGGLRGVYWVVRRLRLALDIVTGALEQDTVRLPGAGMGYGHLPRFWIRAAATRKLRIEVVSSQFYEYRFHVLLRKLAG